MKVLPMTALFLLVVTIFDAVLSGVYVEKGVSRIMVVSLQSRVKQRSGEEVGGERLPWSCFGDNHGGVRNDEGNV